MATQVDWGNAFGDPKDGGGRRGDIFIKFEAGKGKTLRPIGSAVQFVKIFISGRSINVDPGQKEQAEAALSAQSGNNVQGKKRYAVNVIDREDGKIRILEGGPQIFKHFGNWSRANNNAAPGGHEGMDWTIVATGEGLNREYTTTAIRPAPFTTDEIKRARESKELYSLLEYFKSCPMEELIEKAFGEKTSGPASASAERASASASASVGGGQEAVAAMSDDPASW